MSTDTLTPAQTSVNDERKLLELLEEALEKPEDQQKPWLQTHCPPTLRERAFRLLRAADEVSGENLTQTTLFAATKIDQLVGSHLGAYHIESLLGEGGMGQVYLAKRDDGTFEQTVAVKVIRSAALNSQVVHQFESERQILSDLHHPNIATLLDGGTTEDGLPYVVMEYVQGVPLDTYIEREKLTISQRLHLFVDVCAAVEHAHRALIIHRDIKPANILVTQEGIPKLLDFGIAKSLQQTSSDGQGDTETVAMLLTPAYASPEQITGNKLTTATDVYSLGVVLFQCLTGERPFETSGLTPSQQKQLLTQQSPEKPSTRLRHSHDGSWQELRGDLDAIVLRALASKTDKRYSSVAEFSADISRYLQGLPVSACGDSATYRLKKFIARHKWLVAASAVTVFALMTSYVITLKQYQVAIAERERADERFDQARNLAKVVFYEVYDDIKDIQGTLGARERIAEVGVNYLNKLAADAHAPDNILLDLGVQYTRLSDLYGGLGLANLGDTATSMALLLKAEIALNKLLDRNPDDADVLYEMIWVKRLLTNQVLFYELDTGKAKKLALEGLALADQGTLPSKPRNWALESRKWNMRFDYLKVLNWESENVEALSVLNQYLVEADDDLLRENLRGYDGKMAYLIGLRGDIFADTDQADKAIPDFENALKHYQGRFDKEPSNSVLMVQVMRFNANLARMHTRNSSWQKALKHALNGLAVADRLLELDPRDAGSQRNRASQLQVVAIALNGNGDASKARETIKEAVEIYRQLSLADANNSSTKRDHAQALYDAGNIYQLQGTTEAACAFYRHSETLWKALEQEGELSEYDRVTGVEAVAENIQAVCAQ